MNKNSDVFRDAVLNHFNSTLEANGEKFTVAEGVTDYIKGALEGLVIIIDANQEGLNLTDLHENLLTMIMSRQNPIKPTVNTVGHG